MGAKELKELDLCDDILGEVFSYLPKSELTKSFLLILRERGNWFLSRYVRHKEGDRLTTVNPDISAGSKHSLFLTDNGRVYSCGEAVYDQLGHGDGKSQYTPKLIQNLTPYTIVQVEAGFLHSLFLTNDGKVFSCGDGNEGALGHGDKECKKVPTLITALESEKVIKIAALNGYSIFICESGNIFSCGKGKLLPELFMEADKNTDNYKFHHHDVVLKNGGVYSRGEGLNGQLGTGRKESKVDFVEVESLREKDIVDIEVGSKHTIFLDKNGYVYTCGYGFEGALGHGSDTDKVIPERINNFCLQRYNVRNEILKLNKIIESLIVNQDGRLSKKQKVSLTKIRKKLQVELNSNNNYRMYFSGLEVFLDSLEDLSKVILPEKNKLSAQVFSKLKKVFGVSKNSSKNKSDELITPAFANYLRQVSEYEEIKFPAKLPKNCLR